MKCPASETQTQRSECSGWQKTEYLHYLRAVEPKLKAKAVIVADNVIRFADEMRDFLDAVQKDPKCQTAIIRASEEKHDGMAVIYRANAVP
jgi:predicted O-methyltransferase YrrM